MNLLLRDKIWNLPWTCCLLAFYIVTPGPAVIRTVGKYNMVLHIRTITDIVCPRPTFLRRRLTFYFGKAIRLFREVLIYVSCINERFCLSSSMCRFIRPLFIPAPPDSNVVTRKSVDCFAYRICHCLASFIFLILSQPWPVVERAKKINFSQNQLGKSRKRLSHELEY